MIDADQAHTSIAVIGAAGRFPGAANIDALWENLCKGVESISRYTRDELIVAGVPARALEDPSYVWAKGELAESDCFDAGFFGYGHREVERMDPQQRLLLECAWEALEHAGYDSARYPGRIGVFAGCGSGGRAPPATTGEHGDAIAAMLGSAPDYLTTRISYELDLRGPSIAVQTACSTSLAAVHLACQSLLVGECDMALAGGVSVRSPQRSGYLHQAGGILSRDGHCRAFDARADGTVPGCGIGLVVLKRLEDVVAESDTVHALIRGSAINNDGGAKVGFTAPSVEGQAAVITEALAVARLAPTDIGYMEAHGTGTRIGDAIELAALGRAFDAVGSAGRRCLIGSIKTNIGHLDAASGIAGLIKVVLALKHGRIPPSLHFESPNSMRGLDRSPFEVAARLADWPEQKRRRAGVSSFGFGGTNVHVVLEEAPPAQQPRVPAPSWQLIRLSARTSGALQQMRERLAAYLLGHPEIDLADAAWTLGVGRRAFAHRLAVAARDASDAVAVLSSDGHARLAAGVAAERPLPVALVFPGQGAQHPGMAEGLYRDMPRFRDDVDDCSARLVPHLGLDLAAALFGPAPRGAELQETHLAQPALFVVAYALARLWMSCGVEPHAMLGHSVGEYVAACLAGVFSLDDALRLVAVRGRLMQAMPPGGMLAARCAEAAVLPLLGPDLDLAAVNGPDQCVLAGAEDALREAARRLAEQRIATRRLTTTRAFHSAAMIPMLDRFRAEVARTPLSPPQRPMLSGLTGTWLTATEVTDPTYWVRQARETVRFGAAVDELLREPRLLVLEVGPGAALATLIAERGGEGVIAVSSLPAARGRGDDRAALLEAMGRLWIAGAAIDPCAAAPPRRRVPLPTYPFERRRYRELEPVPTVKRSTTPTRAAREAQIHVPVWRRAALQRPAAAGSRRWLILGDDDGGLAGPLCAALTSGGDQVVRVRSGEDFAERDGAYWIDPRRGADYGALLARLAARGLEPDRVVHLWSAVDPPADAGDEALERGLYSVLQLAQALGLAERPARIDVVASQVCCVAGDDAPWPERAALLGACRVIPQEYVHLACRAIDVRVPAPASAEHARLVARITEELRADGSEAVVAYRGTHRWVEALEGAPEPAVGAPPVRLRPEGKYLITGGLGGVGFALAEHLARRAATGLALVGRTALPARSAWDAWLSSHGASDPVARRIVRVRELEALGAEVLVLTADVCDPPAIAGAIVAAERRFGPLHGAIHAAGLADGGLIHTGAPELWRRVLRSKVHGTRALAAALAGRQLDFFALCSSITSRVGGVGQAGYAAANASLDAFAQAAAATGRDDVVSIAWDAWAGVGMTASASAANADGHPLVGPLVRDDAARRVYVRTISAATLWVLDEHRLSGEPLLPGAALLDAMCTAAGAAGRVREAWFVAPLFVPDGEARELRISVDARGDDAARVTVESRAPGGAWREHASAQIERTPPSAPSPDVPEASRGRPVDLRAAALESEHGLRLGPRWDTLVAAYEGDGAWTGELALGAAFVSDLHRFTMHPALLDRATGLGLGALGRGPYLALGYRGITLHGPLTQRIRSRVVARRSDDAANGVLAFSVTIDDEAGRRLVTIDEYLVRRLERDAPILERGAGALRPLPAAQATAAFERVVTSGVGPLVVISCHDPDEIAARAAPRPAGAEDAQDAEEPTWADAPTEELERRIAAIWSERLGVAEVAPSDDFFALGGDSVIGIEVIVRINRLGFRLSPVHLFEHPTVADLARAALASRAEPGSPTPTEEHETSAPRSGDAAAAYTVSDFPEAQISETELAAIVSRFDPAAEVRRT